MNKIGLKLANGEFYPVLDDGLPAQKRLTVTTVRDRQKSVQIDIYRGDGRTVESAEYMGSLVIESIVEAPAGEPNIRLDLELDEEGLLKASVEVEGSDERQSLKISLETLGEEQKYEIPDFDFEEERTDSLPDEATSPEEGAGLLAAASSFRDEERGRSPWFYIAGILILIAAFGLIYFLYQCAVPSTAAVTSSTIAAQASKPLAAAATTTTSVAVTISTTTLAPQAASALTPNLSPGKPYHLKWGDTLWDLAWVYYRDPWLYPRIAKANKIKNPDFILAGSWIDIPSR